MKMESLSALKVKSRMLTNSPSMSSACGFLPKKVPTQDATVNKPGIIIPQTENYQGKAKIEDQMNNENLEMLQKIFEEADADCGGGLDIEEFREAMRMAFGNTETLDDKQLEILFMKVDTNCDGTVDWEEFCSYMLLENQQKDSMGKDFADLPFPHPAREMASPHHDSLARITFLPNLCMGQRSSCDETVELENGNGRYISCSKDGVFVFWGNDLQIQRTIHLTEMNATGNKVKPIWINDVICLANVKKVAIATTERDITFYDCSANNFEKQFVVTGLDHCVLCMDYWYDPKNLNHSRLLLGDAGGSVACITFTQATVGLFDVSIGKQSNMSTSTVRRIPFPELFCGRHPSVSAAMFNNLHDDWVRKVKYIASLQCFISCANTSQTSLFLGDLQSKKMQSYFKIRKGVYAFDYDKENNVIVTGGLDRYVRLWNPYVTSKPTSVLKGHHSSVVHIIVQGDQIISLSKDKVVKIWDTRNHCCIQTIPRRLIDFGAHAITTAFYNRKTHTLLLGSNTITVLEKNIRSENNNNEDEPMSHPKPLCGALYNELYNQVVSACHGSVVNVWHVETGEKAIMFSNAHDGHEITAMSFDRTKRRLITGSRNGTVKIWNFNNGACLSELNAMDDGEITGIVCPKQRIVTVGWHHKITVYCDVRGAEDDPPKLWNSIHKDDILTVDFTKSGSMATASYDGQVTYWNIETGYTYCQINVNKAFKTHAQSVHAVTPNDDTKRKRPNRPETGFSSELKNHLSVDKVLFLRNREANKDTATLLTSVGGSIQAWSIHGILLGEFEVTNDVDNESVLAMQSDEQNHVLFTGDSIGYIKVWDISTYRLKKKSVPAELFTSPLDNFSKRRQTLPLITPSIFINPEGGSPKSGNASRSTSQESVTSDDMSDTTRSPPACLISYRGHCQSIVTIDYIEDKQLLVTASTDCFVRLWTISGKYIGTFGQKPWDSLENTENEQRGRKLPSDIQRNASPQTIKVMNGSAPKWKLTKNIFTVLHLGQASRAPIINDDSNIDSESDDEIVALSRPLIVDISLTDILGKNYKPKQRHRMPPNIKPKINNLQCVAFSSLPFTDLEPIVELKMPPVLAQVLAARQHQRSMSPTMNDHGARGRNGKKGPFNMRHVTLNRILPVLALKK